MRLDGEMIPAISRMDCGGIAAQDSQRFLSRARIKTWRRREGRVMDEFAPQSLLPSLISGCGWRIFADFFGPHLWKNAEDDPEELANLLAAGGPADATLRSNDALYRVAAGSLPTGNVAA